MAARRFGWQPTGWVAAQVRTAVQVRMAAQVRLAAQGRMDAWRRRLGPQVRMMAAQIRMDAGQTCRGRGLGRDSRIGPCLAVCNAR